MTAPLELPVLESKLAETVDWMLIQSAAVDGLRIQIIHEERGMEIDHKAGRDIAERLARLDQTKRALDRAMAWRPIDEPPTRKPRTR